MIVTDVDMPNAYVKSFIKMKTLLDGMNIDIDVYDIALHKTKENNINLFLYPQSNLHKFLTTNGMKDCSPRLNSPCIALYYNVETDGISIRSIRFK
jgi:hypothetical protein